MNTKQIFETSDGAYIREVDEDGTLVSETFVKKETKK